MLWSILSAYTVYSVNFKNFSLFLQMLYASVTTINITWNTWFFVKCEIPNNLFKHHEMQLQNWPLNWCPFKLHLFYFTTKEHVFKMRRTKKRLEDLFFSCRLFFTCDLWNVVGFVLKRIFELCLCTHSENKKILLCIYHLDYYIDNFSHTCIALTPFVVFQCAD